MNPFEVFIPEEKKHLVTQEPKYVGMFLHMLAESSNADNQLELSGGMVVCSDRKIAEFLTMLLRAKRFDQFLEQLEQLLFPTTDTDSIGMLRCEVQGQPFNFDIKQVKPMPALKLRTHRVT